MVGSNKIDVIKESQTTSIVNPLCDHHLQLDSRKHLLTPGRNVIHGSNLTTKVAVAQKAVSPNYPLFEPTWIHRIQLYGLNLQKVSGAFTWGGLFGLHNQWGQVTMRHMSPPNVT